MRIIRELQSRSGGEAHSVREDHLGNLFCTCEAARHERECWALKIVRGDREYERIQTKIREKEFGKWHYPAMVADTSSHCAEYMANEAEWNRIAEEYRSNFTTPVVILGNSTMEDYFDDGLEEPKKKKRRKDRSR